MSSGKVFACAAIAALAVSLQAPAAAPASFAPLSRWTDAVASGNASTVRSLYSSSPPALIVIGQEQAREPDKDAAFWASLKAQGITAVQPKVLSLEQGSDQARLVLRVQAQKFGQSLVASAAQVWAKQPDGWHIVVTQHGQFVPDNGRRLPEPAKPNTALYATPQQSLLELKEAMAKAGREHKRVLIVFGANWCYDCHVLDTTFHSADFAPLVDQNFVVTHVSIGDEGRDNNDLARRLGVNLEKGVPALAVIEPDGKVVTAQQNGEFESTTRIGPDDVRAFLERYKPAH